MIYIYNHTQRQNCVCGERLHWKKLHCFIQKSAFMPFTISHLKIAYNLDLIILFGLTT